jgi:hypothetical protein
MQKNKIEKSNILIAKGTINLEESAIEVDGEIFPIDELLKEFDGCDITIRVKK